MIGIYLDRALGGEIWQYVQVQALSTISALEAAGPAGVSEPG
jgi:hypothetical protein